MGHFNFLANANDGTLRSRATTPGDAQEGSGGDQTFDPPEFNEQLIAGQNRNGTITDAAQYFQEFSYTTVASGQMVTSAAYMLYGPGHVPSGDSWSLEIRDDTDWDGTTLTTGDWVSATNLPTLDLLAEFPEIRTISPRPPLYRSGSPLLRSRISSPNTAPLRIVASSNKQRLFFAPGNNPDEFVSVTSSETATGSYRPRLEYSTATKSSISRIIGAEVQLSDGTVAYLEFEGDSLYLRHRTNAGSVTTVTGGGAGGALPVGLDLYQFALRNGLSAFSLTRDNADNLYVVGPSGAVANGICAAAWVKGSGYSWTSKFGLPHQLPTYDEQVNQVSVCWHQVGTGAGYLAIIVSHAQGYTQSNQTVFCTVSAGTLLTSVDILGPGSLVLAERDIVSSYTGAPVNAGGSGLDICAMASGRGVIGGMTYDHGENPSSENRGLYSVYGYSITSSGQISTAPRLRAQYASSGQLKQDGDARAKLVRISDTRFCLYVGGIIGVFTYNANEVINSVGVPLWLMNSGGVGGLTAFPQVLDGSAAGYSADAIYDPATSKVWIYYPDQANPRRIMRTGLNVNTGLLDLTEIQVATNTGASGSTNLRLRLPRGGVDERFIQVQLGNKAGDGTLSTVHVGDTGLNQAPNAPVLNPVSIFSAGAAKTVTWSYSDNNPKDTQSAFQLQIRDQSSGTSVLDTGKAVSTNRSYTIPANTLSNNETYEWRVRTYDQGDAVGAYSTYSVFSTVSTGVVEITTPATDNPSGLVSPNLEIEWTFTASGSLTQSRYYVKVRRTDTGVELLDSGYLSGPEVRSYLIQGLITDVQQQIELRIEDNTGELSNTAIRLVTPIFSGPDTPTFTTSPTADGLGIQLAISNPDATGDLPAAERNDIYRSPAGENTYIKIGESPPNTIYVDYGVAPRALYDYKVSSVAQGHTDSEVIEGVSTIFYGVSLHDPLDAASTVRLFPYGKSNKSMTLSARTTEKRFVGRTYPTYYFGKQQDETVQVEILLDHSEVDTWQDDLDYFEDIAAGKRVYCYRDNRVRKIFGVITEVGVSDTDTGSSISFTVNRAHYDETFVG